MLRNRLFWVMLVLVAVIGTTMEMSKRARSTSKHSLNNSLSLSGMEIKPYSIDYKKGSLHTRTKKIKVARQKHSKPAVAHEIYGDLKAEPVHVAQSESMDLGAPPQTEKQKKLAKKKKDEKAKKDGEEDGDEEGEDEEEVEYDEDGNPIKKKKKAEGEDEDEDSKKEEEDTEVAKDEADKDEEQDEEPAENEADENSDVAAGGGAIGPAPAETPEEEGEDLSEWARALLKKPDFKLMTEFINLRQINRISEAEFMSVINLMLADPRSSIQELAVEGLGSTPSISSFEKLAETTKAANFGSGVSEKAQYYINKYSELRYLSILEGILRISESPYAVLVAATQLHQSAERYLVGTNSQGNDPTAPTDPSAPSVDNSRFYAQFPSLLEALVKDVSDQEAADAVQRALTRLNELLPLNPTA